MELNGKTVIVSGAGAGIGRGLARKAAQRGARVAVIDIREEAAAATRDIIVAAGGAAHAYRGDVTDADDLAQVAARIEADLTTINVVFNNAGVISGGTIMDIAPPDFAWVFDVNVRGLYNAINAFMPALRRSAAAGDLAHVVNLGSENALALPTIGPLTAYTASKHAILGMTDGLRRDLIGTGIGVSIICPGLVQTELWNSKQARPERFGGTVHAPVEREQAMSAGRTVEDTVDTAFEGLDADEFLIITDPRIRSFTVRRLDEIAQALDIADRRVSAP